MKSLGLVELLIILMFSGVYLLVIVVPFWRIATKAGHPGWYSLVAVIPVVNIIALYLFAFSKWPIENRQSFR